VANLPTDRNDFRDDVALTMHELNNVLSVVQLTADLLDRDAVAPAQASETIREQVREGVRIVEQLRRRARTAD
jgi:signal transduction histidine kinase